MRALLMALTVSRNSSAVMQSGGMSTRVSRMGRVSSPCSRAARQALSPLRSLRGKGSPLDLRMRGLELS
jgi:hypothetical protein